MVRTRTPKKAANGRIKVLVTGGRGFLGRTFIELLSRQGVPYTCYDRTRPDAIPPDITHVVHFAGLTPHSPHEGPIAPAEYWQANVEGTKTLLGALDRARKLRRFINIGSAAEYGIRKKPIDEKAKEAPVGDYGKSKLAQSKLVEGFAKERGIDSLNLRVFNVAGAPSRRDPSKVPGRNIFEGLLMQFTQGFKGTITVSHADDERDYVDPEDIAEAVYAALTASVPKRYEVINICSGIGTKNGELVDIFGELLHKPNRVKATSATFGCSLGVAKKAERLLGWRAQTPVRDSVRKALGARSRVLIVGAGVAGRELVKEVRREGRSDFIPVGFVDDDPKKQGKRFVDVAVLGTTHELSRLIRERQIDRVVISTPSVGRELVERVTASVPVGFPVKILPSVSSVLLGKVELSEIRDVDIADLFGRPLVKADLQVIAARTRGKTFVVTGGAGSIGSEIVRQLHSSKARRLIVLDTWEEGIFNLSEELSIPDGLKHPDVHFFIANIRDKTRINELFARFKPDVVFHAAAYKHVPILEDNPDEGHKTNYLGTKNLLDACVQYSVKDFVLISTDKAVNPKSVLGRTKRKAELLVKTYASAHPRSRFCAVRFGNVLNSSGSVVPKFMRQIRDRLAITVTHKDMTRYFMSIPEAVSLVLSSWRIARNGQILVLDMGEPVKIWDLAVRLVRMHGLEPHTDIPIHEVGIRPGEKLHEELSYEKGELRASRVPRIFIAE